MTTFYEICVQDHLDQRWSDWFLDLTFRHTFRSDGQPITILSGEIPDQSALSGILIQLGDLGFTLISVNQKKGDLS